MRGTLAVTLVVCALLGSLQPCICQPPTQAPTGFVLFGEIGTEAQSAQAAVLLWSPNEIGPLGEAHVTFSSKDAASGFLNASECCWIADAADSASSPGPHVEYDLRGPRYLLGARVQVFSATNTDLTAGPRCTNYTLSYKASALDANFITEGTYEIPYPRTGLDLFLDQAIKAELVRITCVNNVGGAALSAALLIGRAVLEDTLQTNLAYNIKNYELILENPQELEGTSALDADVTSRRTYGDGYDTGYRTNFLAAAKFDETAPSSEMGASVAWSPLAGITVSQQYMMIDLMVSKLLVGVAVGATGVTNFDVKSDNAVIENITPDPADSGRTVYYYFPTAVFTQTVSIVYTPAGNVEDVALQVAGIVVEGIAYKPCCTGVNSTALYCCMVGSGILPHTSCDATC